MQDFSFILTQYDCSFPQINPLYNISTTYDHIATCTHETQGEKLVNFYSC